MTQMDTTNTARLATSAAVADRLSVSTRTIARMVEDGTLTPIRIRPRVVRFDLEEVEKVLKKSGIGRAAR